jgi:hypothetical protein
VITNQPIWTIIDAAGDARPVSPGYTRARRELSARKAAWPAFSQLIVSATPRAAFAALRDALRQLDDPSPDLSALRHATCGPLTLIAEPGEDMGLRLVDAALADLVLTTLGADGALVSHDAEGTLQLALYAAGAPTLSWYDPLIHNQGVACTHLPDGRFTEEDSRHFALRALSLAEDTAELDRYAFIELMLQPLGLPLLSPDLIGLDVLSVNL